MEGLYLCVRDFAFPMGSSPLGKCHYMKVSLTSKKHLEKSGFQVAFENKA